MVLNQTRLILILILILILTLILILDPDPISLRKEETTARWWYSTRPDLTPLIRQICREIPDQLNWMDGSNLFESIGSAKLGQQLQWIMLKGWGHCTMYILRAMLKNTREGEKLSQILKGPRKAKLLLKIYFQMRLIRTLRWLCPWADFFLELIFFLS